MNRITTFLIGFCFTTVLLAQIEPRVYYDIRPIPIGANKIVLDFQLLLPEIETEVAPNKITGIIDFSLQIVDKKNVDNLEEKGEEIAFFIESIRLDDPEYKTTILTLPENVNLSNILPKGKVYRLIHKYDSLLLLNPEDADFEVRVPVQSDSNIVNFSKAEIKNNLEVTYVNFPESVNRSSSFIIETKITNTNISTCILPNVKMEIHIVDKKDLNSNKNIATEQLVSKSEEITTIQAGTTNYYFKLQAPEIPSAFLPEGKIYRLRLVNDSLSNCMAKQTPVELKVAEKKQETNSYQKNNEVIIYPNPAKDFLIIKTKKKSKSYKIYDISGELVKEQAILRRISIADLKPGIYLLETDFGVTRFTKK